MQETGEYFSPLQSHGKIAEVEIGGVAIYLSFGEFRRANSYCHLSDLSDLSDDDNAANKTYELRILEGELSSEESDEETHGNT
ncbi:hypothetical protein TNCV_951881 [Trichonephila clavipes]|nr:hypothetical protein TNCV_951881 [Trichonephila clavipes]